MQVAAPDGAASLPEDELICRVLDLLLAFMLSSPAMGVLGSGDGLFLSSFWVILPNSGTLRSLMPAALHGSFLTVLLSPYVSSNSSVGQRQGSFSPSSAAATRDSALNP